MTSVVETLMDQINGLEDQLSKEIERNKKLRLKIKELKMRIEDLANEVGMWEDGTYSHSH